MGKQGKRDYCMDILKLVFAALIVMYHSKNIVNEGESSWFPTGVLAVEFFFITSGYYFAKSAAKADAYYAGSLGTDTAYFMWHKICGFMPHYAVAWVIAFVVRHIWMDPMTGSIARDFVQGLKELCLLEGTGITHVVFNNVTWYLSSMLLAMFMLYPLMRKYGDTFFCIIAPLIVMILYSIMFITFMNLKKPNAWVFGIMTKGTLRAVVEVSLGCILYRVKTALDKYRFRMPVRVMLTAFTLVLWVYVVLRMSYEKPSKGDFDMILLFAIGILLTVSNLTYLSSVRLVRTADRLFPFVGEFSFSLFLGHGFWSQVFNSMGYWDGLSYEAKLKYYFALAAATALVIMLVSHIVNRAVKAAGSAFPNLICERNS